MQAEGSNPRRPACLGVLDTQGAEVNGEVSISPVSTVLFHILYLCLVLSIGSLVCPSSIILPSPCLTLGPFEAFLVCCGPASDSSLLLLPLPSSLSYCWLCSLLLGSRMAQLLLTNCPTAMVSGILERLGSGVCMWHVLCPSPLNPWIWASVVDDQAWARPPKPPTFGEFLSQHRAEVSSRRRRKNSRPQAKVAPRAYRWGAPPSGHSPPQCAWVRGVLSGFSWSVYCSVYCPLCPQCSVPDVL